MESLNDRICKMTNEKLWEFYNMHDDDGSFTNHAYQQAIISTLPCTQKSERWGGALGGGCTACSGPISQEAKEKYIEPHENARDLIVAEMKKRKLI